MAASSRFFPRAQNSVASPNINISIACPADWQETRKNEVLMKSYNIAVIGGDGTGPEVVHEAVKVLDAAVKKFDFKLDYTKYDIGGDRYIRTGEVLPDSVLG